MDADNGKNFLNMYKPSMIDKINNELEELKKELTEDDIKEVDALTNKFVVDFKAELEAKATKKQKKEDNQVNCCPLF